MDSDRWQFWREARSARYLLFSFPFCRCFCCVKTLSLLHQLSFKTERGCTRATAPGVTEPTRTEPITLQN